MGGEGCAGQAREAAPVPHTPCSLVPFYLTNLCSLCAVAPRGGRGWGASRPGGWVYRVAGTSGGGASGRRVGLALDLHLSLRLSKLCAPRRGVRGLGPGRRRLWSRVVSCLPCSAVPVHPHPDPGPGPGLPSPLPQTLCLSCLQHWQGS